MSRLVAAYSVKDSHGFPAFDVYFQIHSFSDVNFDYPVAVFVDFFGESPRCVGRSSHYLDLFAR